MIERRIRRTTPGLLLAACVSFLVALCPPASALDESSLTRIPVWSSEQENLTNGTALGDVDGDGDLDLVCGNRNRNTLYLNSGSTFESTPAWSSDSTYTAMAVALGDVDGDGDLDLVCGNIGRNTLYLNVGGVFESSPVWSSDSVASTRSIVLGDVDGDGDLDLVCGNYPGTGTSAKNRLYRNVDGMFERTPAWSSGPADVTFGIALGDVDGDGDLDLVCTDAYRSSSSSSLYLNTGDTFETEPVQRWGTAYPGNPSVALGDVDGDGDLDVVCGALDYTSCVEVYRNMDGRFDPVSSWTPLDRAPVHGLALADMDGDGDLDLLCVGLSAKHRLYENIGGTGIFGDEAAWTSDQPKDGCWAVSVGDIDGNGLPEPVCGNSGPNTLYRNLGVAFETTPHWSTPDEKSHRTYAVALSDVDLDGDLDLVAANPREAYTLYRNKGDGFEDEPAWTSDSAMATVSIALGDVNGDGYPDLVCGNYDQPNTIHLSVNGSFRDTPDWYSDGPDTTWSVALGDVNGDGRLDLVCGNYRQKTRLYLNEGDLPATSPAWSTEVPRRTLSVALGDVDNDGDLDLVVSSASESGSPARTLLYRNVNGIFESAPSSDVRYAALSIALGDVDGDGDVDLACGSSGENKLFRNIGGTFETTPVWSSDRSAGTHSIAFGDIDGDGDLDLACGNSSDNGSQSNTIYLNEGGVLGEEPAWLSEPVDGISSVYDDHTYSIALGDVDSDGDLDMVCGNYKDYEFEGGGPQPNTLYRNTSRPVFKGDPAAPTRQLPNNGACLRNMRIESVDENTQRVRFTLVDVESDPVSIVAEYQHSGSPAWHPIEGAGLPGLLDGLDSSPTGTAGVFDWDVSRLPFDDRDVVLRLRAVESPRRISQMEYIDSYALSAGRIVPARPEITTPAGVLSFGSTVTVGDTATAVLAISNRGTRLLTVTEIELPSQEMRRDPAGSFDVAPGGEQAVTVFLEPRRETEITGDIRIHSNDPTSRVRSVPIEADLVPLRFHTELRSLGDEIPLGEAAIVIVTPEPGVRVESGCLFHRPVGSAAFRDSVFLSASGANFIAVIPGDKVTEVGLEYYIRVENSGVFGTDPTEAPDRYFTQAVKAPGSIVSSPQPTDGSEFIAGRSIRVQVVLPTGTEFRGGLLNFRRGGDTDYQVSEVLPGDPLPFAEIPDSLVTARGLEYWVKVSTATTAGLTDPGEEARTNPRRIRVTVPDLIESGDSPVRAYRMVSVPLDFGDRDNTLEQLLSDQKAFGPYDPNRWRSFRYLPDDTGCDSGSGCYREIVAGHAVPGLEIRPGRGFWLVSREEGRIRTGPVDGLSVPTDQPFVIELKPGWNQIGNPFDFPVAWDDVRTASGLTPGDIEDPQRWNVDQGGYEPSAILAPFEGVFVLNDTDSDALLRVPPREAASPVPAAAPLDADDAGWWIRIAASAAGIKDRENSAAVVSGAGSGRDRWDRSDPPLGPERSLSLYFPQGESAGRLRRLAVDARAPGEAADHRWAFDLAKNFATQGSPDEVSMDFTGLETVPLTNRIVLHDRLLGRSQDLRAQPHYAFFLAERAYVPDRDARFLLLVGSDEFVDSEQSGMEAPRTTRFLPASPNPFRASTILNYELSQPGEVTIRVFDVRGAVVKEMRIFHGTVGRYEMRWRGDDNRGGLVSPGVYFCRMKASGFTDTQKLIRTR